MNSEIGRSRTYLAGWFAALVSALALHSRDLQMFAEPQLWAEDGREFLVGSKLYGLHSIIMPYAGYLHFVPRVIAVAASLFSATVTPQIFAVACFFIVIWSAVTIATARLPYAGVCGGALLLAPHSGEIFGNVTNLQWFMSAALAVVIATTSPSGRIIQLNQKIFVAASALSGPFSVILLPIAAWRLVLDPGDRHGRWVCGIAIAGGLVQLAVVLHGLGPHLAPVAPVHLARSIVDRWIGQLANGGRTSTIGQWCADLLIVAGIMPLLLWRDMAAVRLLAFGALSLGAVWFKFLGEPRESFDNILGNDRYLYVPRLIVIWILIMLLLRRKRSSILAAVALAVIAVNYASWTVPKLPVLPWRSEAWKIDEGQAVRIVINPLTGSDQDAWTVTLPERP